MSRGGRPALDTLGSELRRGEEDWGPLDGTEYVAVFSNKDAPGRPREGRVALQDVGFGGGGGGSSVPDFYIAVEWTPGAILQAHQASRTINIPGAAMGARVAVTFGEDLKGCFAHGYVRAINSVNCYIANLTGVTQTIINGTLFAAVWNIGLVGPEPPLVGEILMETGDSFLIEDGSGVLMLG